MEGGSIRQGRRIRRVPRQEAGYTTGGPRPRTETRPQAGRVSVISTASRLAGPTPWWAAYLLPEGSPHRPSHQRDDQDNLAKQVAAASRDSKRRPARQTPPPPRTPLHPPSVSTWKVHCPSCGVNAGRIVAHHLPASSCPTAWGRYSPPTPCRSQRRTS